MPIKKRKVLFVIVEGESDSLFFYEELQRKYTNELVLIKAYHGDIFTDPELRDVEIRERIRQFFIRRMEELKLKDFLGIIHFSDTDGAFVADDKVQVDPNQSSDVLYNVNGIYVSSQEKQKNLHYRNKVKMENTRNVCFIDCITYKGVKIPYRLYYLSQQLEHVVFDELNVPRDQKEKKIVTFLKNQPIQSTVIYDLLEMNRPPIPHAENEHVESWNFIFQGDHSLKRYTNAILMYEFIDQLLADLP